MRKYTINLPRGLEVDIFNLPEDFKEQVEETFKQPTAFDVDKVVQQLEKRSTLAKPVGWTKSYEIVILNDALEIVKGGGVE